MKQINSSKIGNKKLYITVCAVFFMSVILYLIIPRFNYRVFLDLALIGIVTALVYYLVRGIGTEFIYIISDDEEFIVTKKVGSFEKILLTIKFSDIKELRPYAKGDKGQNFCLNIDLPKYTAICDGTSFIFQPNDEFLALLK